MPDRSKTADTTNRIIILMSMRDENIGDAGRYWQDDPYTVKLVNDLNAEIAELERSK